MTPVAWLSLQRRKSCMLLVMKYRWKTITLQPSYRSSWYQWLHNWYKPDQRCPPSRNLPCKLLDKPFLLFQHHVLHHRQLFLHLPCGDRHQERRRTDHKLSALPIPVLWTVLQTDRTMQVLALQVCLQELWLAWLPDRCSAVQGVWPGKADSSQSGPWDWLGVQHVLGKIAI